MYRQTYYVLLWRFSTCTRPRPNLHQPAYGTVARHPHLLRKQICRNQDISSKLTTCTQAAMSATHMAQAAQRRPERIPFPAHLHFFKGAAVDVRRSPMCNSIPLFLLAAVVFNEHSTTYPTSNLGPHSLCSAQ